MPKRKETIEIEDALIKETRIKRLYGCEEVTIGFYNAGKGNEIVDFITMDSKGIIKCYEIKVTLQDLKSRAKKSWYGHYNYLVVSLELYSSIFDWDEYIPPHVGIIVGSPFGEKERYLESTRKAKKSNVSPEIETMLKESMVRSMYWKIDKYKNANNLEKQKVLMSNLRKAEQERDKYYEIAMRYERIIDKYERYKAYNDDLDVFDLEQAAKEEYDKYREKKKGLMVV